MTAALPFGDSAAPVEQSMAAYILFIAGLVFLLLFGRANITELKSDRTKPSISELTASPAGVLGREPQTERTEAGKDWPSWIIAGASVVNVAVPIMYAVSTRGIRRETQRQAQETRRQAELTAELARQAASAFRLQVLTAYQEEIRAARARRALPDRIG